MLWGRKEEGNAIIRFGYTFEQVCPDFCYATPGVLVLIASSGDRNQFVDSYSFEGPIDYSSECFVRALYNEKIKKGELELKEAPLSMLLTNKNKKIRSFVKGRVQEKYKKLEEVEILYGHPKFQDYLKRWLNGNKKFNPQQFFQDYRKKLYKEAKHLTKKKIIIDRIKQERVTVTINIRKWAPQDIIVSGPFDEISEILEVLKENTADAQLWFVKGEGATFEKISDEQLIRIKEISPRMAKEIKRIRDEVQDLREQAKIVTDFQGIDFNEDIQKVVWGR